MRKDIIAVAFSCAVVLALPGPTIEARASLVVGNLTAAGTGGYVTNNADTTKLYGSSFALDGSFTPAELSSVTIRLSSNNGIVAHAWLYSESSTLPGNVLVDLGTTAVVGGGSLNFANYSFAPLSPLTLQPSTSYWLVIGETNAAASLGWNAVNPPVTLDPGSDPAASIMADFAIKQNSAASWAHTSTNPGKFAVYAVPEPATVGVLALGALGVLRRCRACSPR